MLECTQQLSHHNFTPHLLEQWSTLLWGWDLNLGHALTNVHHYHNTIIGQVHYLQFGLAYQWIEPNLLGLLVMSPKFQTKNPNIEDTNE